MIRETRNAVDFGFKVGDILKACWGYDANIYNFYEVRECLPASDRAGFDLYYRAALQYLNGCAVREAV